MSQFDRQTVTQIRQSIGSLAYRGRFLHGTVLASPAPTTTTFALTAARKYPNSHFKGAILYAVSGTGAGQSGYVSDSAVGTGVITTTPALTTTFDATTQVELWPDQVSPDDILSNLNLAIADIQDRCDVYVETTSPTLDSTYRIVTIPTTYVKLHQVRYLDSGGIWRVFRASHTPDLPGQEQGRDFTIQGRLLYLSEAIPSDILGTSIYVTGYRFPARVTLDTDYVEIPAAFAVFRTAAFLEQALVGNAELDPEGHAQRSSGWLALAQQQRDAAPYINYLPSTVPLLIRGS